MANFNGGPARLLMDGVDVTGYAVEVTLDPKAPAQDTTSGNVNDSDAEPGVVTWDFSIKIAYPKTGLQAFIRKIQPTASVLMEYAPEGAVTGTPRHVQQVLILSAPFTQTADKKAVVFDMKAQGQGAPTYNLWAGATY